MNGSFQIDTTSGFQYDVLAGNHAIVENLSSERNPYLIPDFYGTRSDSGIEVNHYRALGHPPVLQGVRILGTAMQMDVRLMRRRRVGGKVTFEEVPSHPGGIVARNRATKRTMSTGATMTVSTFRSAMMNHAIIAGDGFAAIQRDRAGRPLPDNVTSALPRHAGGVQ